MQDASLSGGTRQSGCLLSILRVLGGGGRTDIASQAREELPYRRKDYLFTRAERSFFGVLEQALAGQYLIFAKVRLADLLYLPKGAESRQRHQNRVQSKHVD